MLLVGALAACASSANACWWWEGGLWVMRSVVRCVIKGLLRCDIRDAASMCQLRLRQMRACVVRVVLLRC